EEAADADRIGGVVGALVDHLEGVVAAEHRCCDLQPAGAPAIGQRHLAAGERDLVAGDRHRLEDGAADHPPGVPVEIAAVVAGGGHSAASASGDAAASARSRRISSSSAWKST